ncbi:MAG: hypothetical protein ABW095_17755, partial [Candidatus Thiodiazotropha sp.]
MRRILTLFLLFLSGLVMADELHIEDRDGNEITIQKQPADGDLLVIWFVDHAEPREPFDNLLSQLSRDGIEIWRVDLLAAYFLPRSSETVRTLPGDGVAAVISAAHRLSDKRILLASYDRMPLPMLRGVRLWQQQAESSRLLGALLYYPNLFGPAPLAGQDPLVDPILQATNIPLVIYQPELGSQRWRLQQVMQPLWQGGAPAYVYLVSGVRDWFFMGEGDHGPKEKSATDAVPRQLRQFARLLADYTAQTQALPLPGSDLARGEIRTLVALSQPQPMSPFTLQTIEGSPYD